MALAALLLLLACGAGAGGATPGRAVEIYAGLDWYEARPEPVGELQGILETQEPPAGPGARSLLTHVLVRGGERLPLYVAGEAGERLAPFAGREVIVVGKRVDLSSEGHGEELWAGSIRSSRPSPD